MLGNIIYSLRNFKEKIFVYIWGRVFLEEFIFYILYVVDMCYLDNKILYEEIYRRKKVGLKLV